MFQPFAPMPEETTSVNIINICGCVTLWKPDFGRSSGSPTTTAQNATCWQQMLQLVWQFLLERIIRRFIWGTTTSLPDFDRQCYSSDIEETPSQRHSADSRHFGHADGAYFNRLPIDYSPNTEMPFPVLQMDFFWGSPNTHFSEQSNYFMAML